MAIPVILVVADEALLRMLALAISPTPGFEVQEAANGALALGDAGRAARHRRRDDGRADPGEPDGFALARHVRELCPGCAIVVVSAAPRLVRATWPAMPATCRSLTAARRSCGSSRSSWPLDRTRAAPMCGPRWLALNHTSDRLLGSRHDVRT